MESHPDQRRSPRLVHFADGDGAGSDAAEKKRPLVDRDPISVFEAGRKPAKRVQVPEERPESPSASSLARRSPETGRRSPANNLSPPPATPSSAVAATPPMPSSPTPSRPASPRGEGEENNGGSGRKTRYQVAATFTELSRTGTTTIHGFRESSPMLKKAAKTNASRQLLLSSKNDPQTPEAKKGSELLQTLKDRFKTVKTQEKKVDAATHAWQGQGLPKYDEVVALCELVTPLLLADASLVEMTSPCFVFGDIHGNYRDLINFQKASFPLGIGLSTSKILFLGDYVDRGPHSVEVALHLLCLKAVAPNKVVLLRGNHEDSEVNGDEETYGLGSFHRKCIDAFGIKKGELVFNAFNQAFEAMPFCALIDEQVFCVHGGLPRAIVSSPDILRDIASIQRPANVKGELVSDLLWNDPVHNITERNALGQGGYPKWFGPNARGGECATFGEEAVTDFMEKTGVTYIIRAHEKYTLGFGADVGGRVLTVFSSSNYSGSNNQAGMILVQDGQLHVILTKKE